ncbi:S-adenosyl-L-methionine-dependent methyltransferase [Dacryopinax primogenitus]|uniref:S-adenosyl-L-methionine-dependent methyltransferase n=1 Tax=Dacryopinax primogenitus (strain DJM 731) TaxID=1858805 RepID=M5G8D6_DACPD|nr:S-adenosyl-L-methionine-dependent methyltransferase [Dacryopinax primogenitus]EJU00023.1 S-adenosyl-L-methionine-dependent methyltransferase [Dacryopinax primogenitus]
MKTELDTILEALSTCASVLQAALEDEGAPSFRRDDLSHHPWDGGLPGPRGWYARKAIVGLCQRITTLVQDPFERSQIDSAGFALTASLHTVTQCVPPTVAEIVLASGKNGTSLKELAERTELNETKLHYFMEKEGGFMAPTRSTRALLPESYVGDIAGLMNAGIAAASMLKETAKLPSDSRHQWLKENPEELAPFSRAMDTMEKMLDPGLVVDLPIEDFGPNITLVDIGGGVGGLTMQFLKRYPGWKAVLQDQKVVIPQAEAFWRKEAPEIVDAGRVTFLGHSFFEPFPLPPAPEDCPYVFMLKDVIHDWPDDLTTRILKVSREEQHELALKYIRTSCRLRCQDPSS